MKTQYLAGRPYHGAAFEAFESQAKAMSACGYLFEPDSSSFSGGCTQAAVTSIRGQAGPTGFVGSVKSIRRRRCPRASRSLPCLASLQRFQHAAAAIRKKSSLLWTQSPFPASQRIPASTSNQFSGRGYPLVPEHSSARPHHPLTERVGA